MIMADDADDQVFTCMCSGLAAATEITWVEDSNTLSSANGLTIGNTALQNGVQVNTLNNLFVGLSECLSICLYDCLHVCLSVY